MIMRLTQQSIEDGSESQPELDANGWIACRFFPDNPLIKEPQGEYEE
jgi:hypothetical protein